MELVFFVTGGPASDAGVVGRKIVVDAYGPRVAVGGGCYSGKDPTKVDRSAAYMARHIAKAAVVNQVKGARSCIVSIAYGIGQHQPEMLTATTNKGEDVSSWVREKFRISHRTLLSNIFRSEIPKAGAILRQRLTVTLAVLNSLGRMSTLRFKPSFHTLQ